MRLSGEKALSLALALVLGSQSAQALQRPLLFIPGIMGSNLESPETNEKLWGDDVNYLRFDKNRLLLPGQDWDATSAFQVIPSGVFRSLDLFPTSLSWGLYEKLVSFFEQRGSLFWTFPHDWRLPVPELAKQLRAHLMDLAQKHKSPLEDRLEFDVLTHSMGGLIFLEAMAGWAEGEKLLHVKTAFIMNPPLQGSPKMQRLLWYPKKHFTFTDIWAPERLGTLRSLYYLLPAKKLFGIHHKKAKPGFADFTYTPEAQDKYTELSWVDPRVSSAIPNVVSRGYQEVSSFHKKWASIENNPQSRTLLFSNIEKAYMVGAKCKDTYGVAGDGVVTVESMTAVSRIFKTDPQWFCSDHQSLPQTIEALTWVNSKL